MGSQPFNRGPKINQLCPIGRINLQLKALLVKLYNL